MTWRAIGREMSQTSRFTMVQSTTRALPGNFSGGGSTMTEKARERGKGLAASMGWAAGLMREPPECGERRGQQALEARVENLAPLVRQPAMVAAVTGRP